MGKVLVIPDVHERLDRLAAALTGRVEKADRIVFLGDWFDAFGAVDLDRVGRVCGFINGNIDGIGIYTGRFVDMEWTDQPYDRVVPATFLLGNHDCHYFFRHDGFKCSGYEPRKHDVVYANIPDDVVAKFRIFTWVGPYLVSHAGFTEATLPYARPEVEVEALRTARAGGFDPIFGAGRARGGSQRIGGPTWLDWSFEFDHIEGTPQIVGHTNGRDVRIKGQFDQFQSYCLDTALHNIAWVDDSTGEVTIEDVHS